MQFKFISVFAFLAVLPTFAFAKLPAVNVGSGGVSARSAFGDADTTMRGSVSYKPVKRVVARGGATKGKSVNNTVTGTDGDVLSPNLPSSNLWAENSGVNDAPLRMPLASEVTVLRPDFELPDEDLNSKYVADNSDFDIDATMNRMAEIDAQLAKISELQRRANASVRTTVSRQPVVADDDVADVKISRTIVPMAEPDVLIHSVEKHNVAPRATTKNTGSQDSLAGLSPTELRKAFRKTFLSENKHLSAMRSAYADEMDTTVTTGMAGFTAEQNLSEMGSGIRPFEIKVSFRNSDSALSRDNYTLLTTFAGIVVNDPKRAVQILIPNDATIDADDRKLTARRLAIVEQVLRDTGVPEQRIMPVLSNREDDGALVLRNIDSTQYETLTKQQRNQFGKTTSKTYKSMTW